MLSTHIAELFAAWSVQAGCETHAETDRQTDRQTDRHGKERVIAREIWRAVCYGCFRCEKNSEETLPKILAFDSVTTCICFVVL